MEDYAISLLLISLSALFSGLTLGYFTLNTQTLRRQARIGNKDASQILPLRENSNQLLTTLLLGNVAVNAVLSIYLSSLANGIVAAGLATTLIFLFGEIIPQAVLSRHAMRIGAIAAPFVRFTMIVSSPVTFPIAWTLNRLLGDEMPALYSKHELMEIVSEHEDSEHSPIDEDEERIIHGALQFSHTTVREVMTLAERVHMFDQNKKLNDALFSSINELGYSRYPVYNGNRENVIGILYAKDLLIEDDDIPIIDTDEALETDFLIARPGEMLDIVLTRMLKKKKHMCVVINRKGLFVGVITLEDIIEQIIQQEITDEDDTENDAT